MSRAPAAIILVGLLCTGCILPSGGRLSPGPPRAEASGASGSGVQIPFQYNPVTMPAVIVALQINGKPALPFLLDTGLNSPLLIDDWAAHELKLDPTGETVVVAPGNQTMLKVPVKVSVRTTGGGSRVLDSAMGYIGDLGAVTAGENGPRLAGIIGTPMFESSTCRFDFASKTLTLWKGSVSPTSRGDAQAIPLKENVHEYTIRVSLPEGLSTDLLVDTGSTDSSIPPELAAGLHGLPTVPQFSTSLGGLLVTDEILLPRVQIGAFIEPSVIMTSTPASDVPRLGLSFLSRFRMTLDFPGRLATLEHSAVYSSRSRLPGARAIVLSQRDRGYFVGAIDPASPAAAAGVRPGDRVLETDGMAMSLFGPDDAQAAVDGFAGARARLTLSRQRAEKLQVSFDRLSEFAAASDPVAGMTLEQEKEGSLLISAIKPGSAGDHEGLHSGDEIIAVDGKPVNHLTPAQLALILTRPQISLTIQPKEQEAFRIVALKAIK